MTLELLANSAIRMALIGAAAWLALRLLRVRNPHVETLVWRMWLLASLVLPLLLLWRLAPSFTTSLQLPVISAADADALHEVTATGSTLLTSPPVLAAIYLLGVLLLLARLATGLAGMWRISRAARALATPDDVRVSARITSPATFGATVLLPHDARDWPPEKLTAVLLHERMHVRGRDGYWSWLAQLHTAVFWFNPLVWWLQRRLAALAETTSDDAVVAARHDPVAYAELLLDFSRQPNSRSVVMSVAESNVATRIERLLAKTPPGAVLPRIAGWAALVALVPVVILAATSTRAATADAPAAMPAASAGKVRLTEAADPDHYYPEVARAANAQGDVIVEVQVDPQGKVVGARAIKTNPADDRYGFAEAAVKVAANSTFTNPNAHAASLRFMVKFAAKPPGTGVALKGAADPDLYYPAVAKAEKVTGSVVLEVDLDPNGTLIDARVIEVQPADPRFGFADAALEVARNSKYRNTTNEVAKMKFKVKFALTADPPAASAAQNAPGAAALKTPS